MKMAAAMIKSKGMSASVNVISADLVEKWIAFAQVKPTSEKSYRKGIHRLAEYCAENRIHEIREFSREMFVGYRDFLVAKYSGATVNLYLTAAKLFCSFLQLERVFAVNPAEHLKGVKVSTDHKKDALSADDTKMILASFDTSTLKGKRDKAMYALMTTAGLRTIEISRALVGDIELFGGDIFLRVQGKGRSAKDSKVRVADGVYQLIQDYLSARGEKSDSSPLFASLSRRNLGGAMTTSSISRIIKDALKAAGYNSRRLTAHSLRHTAATVMLMTGATIREVQQVLRHSSIVVTQIYLHELDRLKNRAESLAAAAFGI